jgi:hypothetical protein
MPYLLCLQTFSLDFFPHSDILIGFHFQHFLMDCTRFEGKGKGKGMWVLVQCDKSIFLLCFNNKFVTKLPSY